MQSSKSKAILVIDEYKFYKEKENKIIRFWNCAQYQTLNRKTTAITNGEQVISIRGNHNDDVCFGKNWIQKSLKKNEEFSGVSTPTGSAASALLEVKDGYATQLTLSSKAGLFKVFQLVRQKVFYPIRRPSKPKLRRA